MNTHEIPPQLLDPIFHTIRLEKQENLERYLVKSVTTEAASRSTPNLEDSIVHV